MDLLLEIVARSNYRTLIRCAATCRLLRREILSPLLYRRITQASPSILAYLCDDAKKPLALLHPTTGPALSFCHKHVLQFLSRRAVTLLSRYKPVASRRGLVALARIKMKNRPEADSGSDMCVYNPMSGAQTFFPSPPESRMRSRYRAPKYFLLTSADGIDSSFLLLVFLDYGYYNCNLGHSVSVGGKWKYIWYGSDDDFPCWFLKERGNPAILGRGVLHWLTCHGNKIVSFDLGTEKPGSLDLPPTNCNVNNGGNQLYLATTSDRKLLKLFSIQRFIMFVWLQLPVTAAGGSGWSLETVIDMEEKLRSLDPHIKHIEFEGNGNTTGEVVFLVDTYNRSDTIIVIDLETKKMHRQKQGLSLLEIDLESRLQTMKIFS
ncbi:hypothetical protein ACQ4PT_027307 [Festuca glaucescens]